MRVIILAACLSVAPLVIMAADSPNYCLNSETNASWSRMLGDSPDDDLIARLFALRIGLCELVRREAISLERATDIFEKTRAKDTPQKLRRHWSLTLSATTRFAWCGHIPFRSQMPQLAS